MNSNPEPASDGVRTHELKVIPPYFEALRDGSKTFEVRKNDRAFQRGDELELREWHPYGSAEMGLTCSMTGCRHFGANAHYAEQDERGPEVSKLYRTITYVLSGDPRFGGIEPGYVVLGLRKVADV